jgi:hypothetical protein
MCSADSSIEPAGSRVKGFLGWGFQRQCKNYNELKDWAEEWKAFEAHGFIASTSWSAQSLTEGEEIR